MSRRRKKETKRKKRRPLGDALLRLVAYAVVGSLRVALDVVVRIDVRLAVWKRRMLDKLWVVGIDALRQIIRRSLVCVDAKRAVGRGVANASVPNCAGVVGALRGRIDVVPHHVHQLRMLQAVIPEEVEGEVKGGGGGGGGGKKKKKKS